MENTSPVTLTLSVTNPTEGGTGFDPLHRFGVCGGSIGTAANDTWRLSSHRTGAVPGHAEIRFVDGEFCLIDRSGRTFVNSASQPVGRGRRARLRHGDTLGIGRYQIRAELTGPAEAARFELVDEQETSLVQGQKHEPVRSRGRDYAPESGEPLSELRPVAGGRVTGDPLTAWPQVSAASREAELLLAPDPAGCGRDMTVMDEHREHRDGAMILPVDPANSTREREPMSNTITGSRGERPGRDTSRQHISGGPLLKGLEADIDFGDSDEMRLFLEEAGQTLKATVEGLLALHEGEDARHRALRTRLQPIEDNPLRLQQDYATTVHTLFASRRSPVHLAAPAAVRESLASLNHHQLATREAIREALGAILHAFSPEALLRRFHGYRRGLQENEDEGRWAWEMYQHYYRELKSSRQQGFERLFEEVYDQAYDQHLRQLQRENLL